MKFTKIAAGLSLSAVMVLGTLVAAPANAAVSDESAQPLTVADLTMTGDAQQRWQSLPKSRIVINPFDRYAADVTYSTSEVDQNSGPELPLASAYYANDQALRFPQLLSTYRTAAEQTADAPSEALGTPFTSANGWAASNVDVAQVGQSTAVSVRTGSVYGRITKSVTVDLSAHPLLTVDVGALSSGAGWAVEIGETKLLPTDVTFVGENTYDVAALTGKTGTETIEVKLWVSGGAGKSVTFDALTLSAPTENPATDKKVLWRDGFATATGWATGSESGMVTSNGAQGVVAISGSGKTWGSVRKDISVDVTSTTSLAINVVAATHKWALILYVDGTEYKVQADTTATGWTVIPNLARTIGAGVKSISVRVFTTGARPSGVAVDEMVVFDAGVESPWRSIITAAADEYETTWTPSVQTFSASYGDSGTLNGRDLFASTDTIVREVDATQLSGEDLVLAGAITGEAYWDSQQHLLTVLAADYVQVYALPTEAQVGFGPTISDAYASEPDTSSASWTATVPAGSVARVAISFATVSTSTQYGVELTNGAGRESATAEALSARALDLDARIAALDEQWNEYLAGVPLVEDFSVTSVADHGVTEAQTEAAYYRAFINLQQNVIPATPETNSLSAQLGTGKASVWMSGIPGAKNVATWDTLVGLQALVYADPETAWESFGGIMDFVQDEDSEFPGEITNDPAKGGEVLPSRKAQTAWVLYNATGNRGELERIYPALTRVLEFAATNLHWTVKDRGIYNDTQRDSEFVTSLIIDLGYAKKISTLLGADVDLAKWQEIEDHLYDKFDDWFVRTDGVFQQKVTLASDDDDAQVTTGTSANGATSVVAGSLALKNLSERARTAINLRLDAAWKDGDAQFSGLADDIKGPNMNYIVDGLLENDHVADGRAKATVFTDTIVRDIVRAGWFAEVYKTGGNGTSDAPVVDGVRPSLFGIATFVDSIWANNGFRISEGDATFVRLSDVKDGGVQGLSHLGRTMEVSITDSGVTVSGDAVGPGSAVSLDAAVGESVVLPAEYETPLTPFATTTTLHLGTLATARAVSDDEGSFVRMQVETAQEATAAADGVVDVVDAEDGTVLATVELTDGAATMTLADVLPAGEYRVAARFISGNAAWWQSSESTPVTVVVAEASTGNTGGGTGGTGGGQGNADAGDDSASASNGAGEGLLALTGSAVPVLVGVLAVLLIVAGAVLVPAVRRRP